MKEFLNIFSLCVLPVLISVILIYAVFKKTPCYDVFVDGAKEGFLVTVKIIPYLIAIIVSVSMFRESGIIDYLSKMLTPLLDFLKIPADVLPVMFTRSVSGSGTLGIFSDIVNSSGVDSYASKLSAVIVGSSETTFYVLAVYFGAVGIKNIRYALVAGILADLFGIIIAVIVSHYFFA